MDALNLEVEENDPIPEWLCASSCGYEGSIFPKRRYYHLPEVTVIQIYCPTCKKGVIKNPEFKKEAFK